MNICTTQEKTHSDFHITFFCSYETMINEDRIYIWAFQSMRLPIFSLLKVTFSQFGTMFTRFAVLQKSKNIILEFDFFIFINYNVYVWIIFIFKWSDFFFQKIN